MGNIYVSIGQPSYI